MGSGHGYRALGNFVAIDSGRGVVFLCHLQQGSVRAHLHLHAQREPGFDPFSATGIPVAFLNRKGVPRVLDSQAVLAGTPALEPTATASGL